MSPAPITRIALYVRDLAKVAAFYETHFGFRPVAVAVDKTLLQPPTNAGGCALMLLQASKGHRTGQSTVKLVFDVPDVAAAKAAFAEAGLKFGAIHHGPGYAFANARDPAKNLLQISSGYLADPSR